MNRRPLLPRIYIGIVMFVLYLPVAVIVVYSFNRSETDAVWTGATLHWYGEMARNRRLHEALGNSLRVAAVTCLISSVLGTMGALAVSKYRPKNRRKASLLMCVPLVIPEIILGTGLLIFFGAMPLNYGILTIALSHTVICVPYVFIMVSIRLRGMEPSLAEAARDLGASPLRAFATVTLPLLMPAILSGVLISAAISLDSVVISSLMAGPESITLPVRLFSLMRIGVTPEVNALSAVMILCMFVLAGIAKFSFRAYTYKKDM